MPLYNKAAKPRTQFSLLHRSLLSSDELPFQSLVTDQRIAEIFADEGIDFGQAEEAVYTPAITLWGLLSQVFFKEEQRSCTDQSRTRLASCGTPRPNTHGRWHRSRFELHGRSFDHGRWLHRDGGGHRGESGPTNLRSVPAHRTQNRKRVWGFRFCAV